MQRQRNKKNKINANASNESETSELDIIRGEDSSGGNGVASYSTRIFPCEEYEKVICLHQINYQSEHCSAFTDGNVGPDVVRVCVGAA